MVKHGDRHFERATGIVQSVEIGTLQEDLTATGVAHQSLIQVLLPVLAQVWQEEIQLTLVVRRAQKTPWE